MNEKSLTDVEIRFGMVMHRLRLSGWATTKGNNIGFTLGPYFSFGPGKDCQCMYCQYPQTQWIIDGV